MCRCWEQPAEGTVHHWSMETKELLVSVLTMLGQVVGAEVAAAPSSWSRALFWLYNKMEELDWTVRFHLKPVWGEHFKNEVPSSLLTVCDLPEQVRNPLDAVKCTNTPWCHRPCIDTKDFLPTCNILVV